MVPRVAAVKPVRGFAARRALRCGGFTRSVWSLRQPKSSRLRALGPSLRELPWDFQALYRLRGHTAGTPWRYLFANVGLNIKYRDARLPF